MESVARSATNVIPINYDAATSRISPLKKSLMSFMRSSSSFVKLSQLTVSSRRFMAVQCIASPQTEIWTGLETAHSAADIKTMQPTNTVAVKFQITKECSFGEEFLVVGDDPILGSWDPSNAAPLQWSDGHLWTTELDMPAERTIKFKFVLRQSTGDILWQPGPDRVFQTMQTGSGITVTEDWEDAKAAAEEAKEELVTSPVMEEAMTTDPETEQDYKLGVPIIREEPDLNGLKDWSMTSTRRMADEPVLLNCEERQHQHLYTPASMTGPTPVPLISGRTLDTADLAAPKAQEMPEIIS